MSRPWLPAESMPTTSRLGASAIVVLALATLVVLNIGAGALLSRAGHNLAFRLMEQKWALLRRGEPAAPPAHTPTTTTTSPWLILGDSSGNQGCDPRVLGEALTTDPARPARALNLCVVADALVVHDAWMLGEWIHLHGPPAGVVLVHTYDIWDRSSDQPANPNAAIMLAAVPVPLWQWPLDPPMRLTGANRAAFYSTRYAPLYGESETLSQLIADPARTLRRLRDRGDIAWQWPDERGFLATNAVREEAVLRDTRGHLNILRTATFSLSDDNRAALERLDELAGLHGFKIYLAAAPMYRGLWEAPRLQAYHAELRSALATIDARLEHLQIVLAEPVLFDADQMQNADHVVAAGAERYARVLGEAIRAMAASAE